MATLYLVRHGQTEWNTTHRYQGQTDIHLSAEGIRQAEALRERLRQQEITDVYSSDLQRARRTAEIAVSPHALTVKTTPALRELCFGQFEGLTFTEMREQFPEEAGKWHDDRVNNNPPGGENLLDIYHRVSRFVNDILADSEPNQTHLLVSHGGPIRIILCHLLHVDVRHFMQFHVDNASLTIIETYPHGAVLQVHNETCHLKGC